jgi:hypothetical protein
MGENLGAPVRCAPKDEDRPVRDDVIVARYEVPGNQSRECAVPDGTIDWLLALAKPHVRRA